MKKIIILAIIIIGCILITLIVLNISKKKIDALAISDIQSDPASFDGEVTLTGIVSRFSDIDQTVFGVMDTAELLACKNFNCGAYTQLVKNLSDKPIPNLADDINITGNFVERDGYYLFEATNIEVNKNVMSRLVE